MSAAPAAGWDCHVHVFVPGAPLRAGHYAPRPAPLARIEALAAVHGMAHLVIVQPSVYGTDNAVLLEALRAGGGRHRGVAVVDAAASEAELDALHAAGVRGARFNLVSPVGNADADFHALAPRLRARGWHAQWYAPADQLARLAALQAASGLTFVLDHLGGITAGLPPDHAAWDALAALASAGAWLKLSGWYRLGGAAPYDSLHASIARATGLFGERCVWGSDWPHTVFADAAQCPYASMLAPVEAALGAARTRQVLRGGAGLYG